MLEDMCRVIDMEKKLRGDEQQVKNAPAAVNSLCKSLLFTLQQIGGFDLIWAQNAPIRHRGIGPMQSFLGCVNERDRINRR